MAPRRTYTLAVGALAALAAPLAIGCAEGPGPGPDLANGKEQFVAKCGSCHELARAAATGTQGPSLDDAFGPAREDGLGQQTIEGVVEEQIRQPRRGSIMPANLVTGADARDVAAYVAYAAGLPGKDAGRLASAGAAQQSDEPAVAEDGVLEIPADPSGALAYTHAEAEAEAGPVELVMPNESSVEHNIALEGPGVNEEGAVVGQGGESTVEAEVEPGEYEYICTVPGHAEGGMVGTLTVK